MHTDNILQLFVKTFSLTKVYRAEFTKAPRFSFPKERIHVSGLQTEDVDSRLESAETHLAMRPEYDLRGASRYTRSLSLPLCPNGLRSGRRRFRR